jgi:CDP-diacylglycerol--glycerol-3-phosphate 3-phosphatidyltransferase
MVPNIPNMLTLSRLVMAIAFFVLAAFRSWVTVPMLLLAGVTDILDGYLARRWNQQTDFGRIADPAIDKVLICCGFIMLVGKLPLPKRFYFPELVMPWVPAVIVGLELVVTALRSLVESRGTEFAATFWGKSKMALQFTTLVFLMFLLCSSYADRPALQWTGLILVLLTVFATVMSGLVYVLQAREIVGRTHA